MELLDEYDEIWRDVEPFWGFDTAALSVSRNEYLRTLYLDNSGMYVLEKVDWGDGHQPARSHHQPLPDGEQALLASKKKTCSMRMRPKRKG